MERQALVFHVGTKDQHQVQALPGFRVTSVQLLDANGRLQYGIWQTIHGIQEAGLNPSPTGLDLLLLALAVYAADKRISRNEVSQDGWTREIDVHLPVSDPATWNSIRANLAKMLGFLTGDLWRFSFRSLPRQFSEMATRGAPLMRTTPKALCLFSGGLDSFIGAIDEFERKGDPLLISHGWGSSDSSHQGICLEALHGKYGRGRVRQLRSRIGVGEHDLSITMNGEPTERSRSFLFFSLAAASASGLSDAVSTIVPENGLISLNIPLDSLRLGAFSTRTTHPFFLARYNQLLAELGIPTQLINPYRHCTKGEMVAQCLNQQLLRATVADTISCSSANKARWDGNSPGHCGHCVPCLIRRAALLKLGVPDPTIYHLSNLVSQNHASDRSEGEHIRSFQLAIHRLNQQPNVAPILVQKAGPLSDHPGELAVFAAMYQRGLGEVEQLLTGVKAVPHG